MKKCALPAPPRVSPAVAPRSPIVYPSRVRPYLLCAALALAALAPAIAPRAAHADFDPTGRSKKKPPRPATGKPGPGPARPAKAPGEDDEGKSARSPDASIARYTPIALAQPNESVPVSRLVQAYRE